MALHTLVKVSVNNLSDARYCAGMGVAMLGFCLDKDKNAYVSPTDFQEITYWVSGIKIVGEMNQIPENIEEYHFDFIELHNTALLNHFKNSPVPIILRLDILPQSSWDEIENIMAKYAHEVKYFLLQSKTVAIDASIFGHLQRLCKRFSVILGFGISPENVKKIVDEIRPAGISLEGGNEIRPGFKDFEDLSEVLEMLFIEE